ncbi:sensor histidine kinase [Paenibacillus donghaensis]|uniref:histidine kinase n=1 Tax=Paenibacillus donghaensis TaxID=414771 RepID=A0A2Z2K6S7_9BACL|nr:HAMP domain-containing sensor histidine kinase [Paenibacillus donghaensis]ASA20614.1 hypothetical protein B9T62_07285 [Paenibacillus donghaensis]
MNLSRTLSLLIVQVALIALYAGLMITGNASPLAGYVLLSMLAALGCLLIMNTLRTRSNLKQLKAGLARAAEGPIKLRFFATEDRLWNEIIYDINELLRRLERMEQEAVRSQASRKSLLSAISHDIRTPLTSIIGYIDAMKDEVFASVQDKQAYLEILAAKSNALKLLVEDLFTLAKLDADEMPQQPELLDYAELAREALIELLPELRRRGLELTVQLPEEPCLIRADQLSLLRVLRNVLDNAALYGSAGKVLGVHLVEAGHCWRLVIWDQGPGIAEAELLHIFERSYRSQSARESAEAGSGLGLAIAKALVEQNGGSIEADSRPWDRTAFAISFPRHEAS